MLSDISYVLTFSIEMLKISIALRSQIYKFLCIHPKHSTICHNILLQMH
mgnify:CR=1 FL=1